MSIFAHAFAIAASEPKTKCGDIALDAERAAADAARRRFRSYG